MTSEEQSLTCRGIKYEMYETEYNARLFTNRRCFSSKEAENVFDALRLYPEVCLETLV